MTRTTTPLPPFLFLLAFSFMAPLAAAADALQIYNGSDKYTYLGCYNETTTLPNTARVRALDGGANKVFEGTMTATMCLSFCSTGADKEYKYAGLEYSRECWCAQRISGLSAKYDDSACDLPCDGNKGQVCGGSMKLSVYILNSAGAAASASWMPVLAAVSVVAVCLLL
ncbi:WSC domain-containing protein-like protein 2 [Colletotrichum chlorophyti]|uniref:WSC domain-containing protein-like protein 2 n=1 Tax=Colletotrichum chlorophyti TaxID=708187 RepID=A0A1Q8RVT9_9PEZI|nr:WSC domain-containing protein-like protein 2 [Colletotrichum chlorophyti]